MTAATSSWPSALQVSRTCREQAEGSKCGRSARRAPHRRRGGPMETQTRGREPWDGSRPSACCTGTRPRGSRRLSWMFVFGSVYNLVRFRKWTRRRDRPVRLCGNVRRRHSRRHAKPRQFRVRRPSKHVAPSRLCLSPDSFASGSSVGRRAPADFRVSRYQCQIWSLPPEELSGAPRFPRF